MFRDSVKHRRAIVPADHFYEWQVHEGAKAPHAIARADGRMLAFAGLWEYWRQPEGGLLRTFTILTTAANDVLRPVHDRMPVVLEEADWPLWLGEVDGDVMSLANRSVAEFRVWPVSTAVNNVRNDSPDLAAALV